VVEMARTRPTPDGEIALIEADVARNTEEQEAATLARQIAEEELGDVGPRSIKSRKKEVMRLAEEEGRTGELPEVLAKATVDARAAVEENTLMLDVLEESARKKAAKIQEIKDQNLEHFARLAHAKALAKVQRQRRVRQELLELRGEAKEVYEGFSGLRTSRQNRRFPELTPCQLPDLERLISVFDSVLGPSQYPGLQQPVTDDDLACLWADREYPARFTRAAPVPA
jgi:hypothetical protein